MKYVVVTEPDRFERVLSRHRTRAAAEKRCSVAIRRLMRVNPKALGYLVYAVREVLPDSTLRALSETK